MYVLQPLKTFLDEGVLVNASHRKYSFLDKCHVFSFQSEIMDFSCLETYDILMDYRKKKKHFFLPYNFCGVSADFRECLPRA